MELDKAEMSAKRSSTDFGYEHNKWGNDAAEDGRKLTVVNEPEVGNKT